MKCFFNKINIHLLTEKSNSGATSPSGEKKRNSDSRGLSVQGSLNRCVHLYRSCHEKRPKVSPMHFSEKVRMY